MLKCTYDKNDTQFHSLLMGIPTKSARDQIIIAPTVFDTWNLYGVFDLLQS